MNQPTLFLLDGHALVYRAYYAFINRPLINAKGMNTSAAAGFVRTLWEVLEKHRPTHIAVAFDLPTPTFRNVQYPAYKAQREAQPEDITKMLPYIMKILHGFNIPILTMEGFEADDIIGTIAKRAEREGMKVYMMTPDKDYSQLVSPNIFLYKPSRSGNEVEIWGEKEVLDRWQIKNVMQVVDVLGLQGDAVDNIPGIKGIGEKTAIKLLQQYDSVENLIANVHQLSGKLKETVEANATMGLLSKQLATIDIDVPVAWDEHALRLEPINRNLLSEVFKELEFRTLADKILDTPTQNDNIATDLFGNPIATKEPKEKNKAEAKPAEEPTEETEISHKIASQNAQTIAHQYHIVDSPEKIAQLIQTLSKQSAISFDTETTGIDANKAELVGLSFSYQAHEAFYVPIPSDQTQALQIVTAFKPVLENPAIDKIGQNIKYDFIMLKWYGVQVQGKLYDTMIAHYIVEPELRHNLDYLAETYLDYAPISIETLIGKRGVGQLSMRDVPLDKIAEYAAEDADIALQLKHLLFDKIKEQGMDELYHKMEAPLVPVLAELEFNGIRIDDVFLATYSVEIAQAIAEVEKEIYKDAGLRFNIASPKQVGDILFENMKLPYRWKKTKSGQYSTDEEKLSELAETFPFVDKIMRHRTLSKLKSTYVDSLPKMLNPKTNRVHSSFNQAFTATGRLSSDNPNLQNIPIRTAEGKKVREAFVPRDANHILLAADYSQIELRLIAEVSNDEAMLEAFQKNQDIHRATAARVYGVPYDQVNNEQRRNAKTVNFSIIYGAGATNLSRQLDIPRNEAKHLIEQYFAQYSGLKTYMDTIVNEAREKGYVTTLMGRRRYLRDIDSRNGVLRSHAERAAINSPIQGTAADLIKLAMIDIHREMTAKKCLSKMILQVHDELVFDVHISELDYMKTMVKQKMQDAMPNLKVPILVEVNTGNNWSEAH